MRNSIVTAMIAFTSVPLHAGSLACETKVNSGTSTVSHRGQVNTGSTYSPTTKEWAVCSSHPEIEAVEFSNLTVNNGDDYGPGYNYTTFNAGYVTALCPPGMYENALAETVIDLTETGGATFSGRVVWKLPAYAASSFNVSFCTRNKVNKALICGGTGRFEFPTKIEKIATTLPNMVETTVSAGGGGSIAISKFSGIAPDAGVPRVNYSIRAGSSDGIDVHFQGGTQESESDITENQHVFFDVPNSHPGGAFSRTIDATVTCP